MTDLETAVRQMLHDEAISVPTATASPSLLRRARLRRLRNGSGSALAVVALIVAGSVTVSRLGEPDRVNVVTRPSPTTLTPPTTAVPPTPPTVLSMAPPASAVSTTALPGGGRAPDVRRVNGIPQVTATPAQGSAGTRIHVEGDGFTEATWRPSGASLWLTASPSGCALFAEAEHTVTVSAAGRLSGDFVVPVTGTCAPAGTSGYSVAPGLYFLTYQCTACSIAQFTVTGVDPPHEVEAVVDSGAGPGGQWQLKAFRDGPGPACASVFQAGRVTGLGCYAASEQDGNGDDVVRYAIADVPGAQNYQMGITRADVARVRVELVGGGVAERATAAHPSFAANRFVVVFLPQDAVIRALVALDRSGRELTRIVINP